MKIEAETPDEYFANSGEREPELRELDTLIREHAPALKRTMASGMNINMVAYGMMPYKTKSMKEESEWPLVALAAQKNYISLYVCMVRDGKYVAESYADKLGKVNVGKSCIRFKKVSDLDIANVKVMLKDLNKRYESGEKLFGI